METVIKDNWAQIIEFLKENYEVLDILYRTWIQPLEVVSETETEVSIAIDESKQGDITNLLDKRYRIPLQTSIAAITEKDVRVTFVTRNSISGGVNSVSSYYNSEDSNQKSLEEKYPFLKSGYSFDNFVVSASNQMAYNASVTVAENPNGQVFNPLFLYSGPGLGKTHLMHSISRYILEHHPEYKLLYTTSENFTNDVVESIRQSKNNQDLAALPNLREKYRNVDILLIDDIQFIIKKDSTQKEFFHTFEDLFQNGKQLIISCDDPPTELELEERYKTRFQSGLPVDILPPDYETAMAILKNKQESNDDIKLKEEILSYIASNARQSVRALQGAYTKVYLFSKLTNPNEEITLEQAQDVLKDFINNDQTNRLTAEYIIDVVCNHFNVDKERLLSERRTEDIAVPRQICMYLCSQYTSLTQQTIAKKLNRKNHTTVHHSVNKIKEDLLVDNELSQTITMLKKKLNVN
ncbi:MAG: chromosomal replication initiator protein DnaA [Eubacterium sp.]|nr:chromosomal replication initiator protein DnaA [Eubacterium sp.]